MPSRSAVSLQHALVDQGVEHLALVVDGLERARVELLALLLPLLLARALEGGAELVGLDLVALPQHRHRPHGGRIGPPLGRGLDLGGKRVVALEQVLLHAEEGERNRQQARMMLAIQPEVLSRSVCSMSGLRWGEAAQFSALPSRRRGGRELAVGGLKKKDATWASFCNSGGVDGTRTRDLRRDRPAF